jgi:transposase
LPEGTPIELWVQDEARIGQKNGRVRQWARKGTRPRQPSDQRYENAYIFGAACPARDIGAALVMPYADTAAMSEHLTEISRCVAAKAHAIVLTDGAGWHKSAELEVPKNLSLLLLPAYSPELNPQENIWQFLRDNYLSTLVFDSYEAIVEHACEAWNKLTAETGRIASITSRDWLVVNGC